MESTETNFHETKTEILTEMLMQTVMSADDSANSDRCGGEIDTYNTIFGGGHSEFPSDLNW